MRVIAGSARRLILKTIPGDATRPTTDKIKETLFNILAPELYECRFLDVFAGSGAIGIEALSRGASQCTFIEKNPKAAACIKDNLLRTSLFEKAEIIGSDMLFGLRKLAGAGRKYDIVFMDPPYNKGLELECLDFLKNSDIISDDTLIIIEMSMETATENLSDWNTVRIKEYKNNKHVFLRRA